MIFIVDADPNVCRSLTRLFQAKGFGAMAFESGQQFIKTADPGAGDYVVLDVQTADLPGFEVKKSLSERGIRASIIITSAAGDSASRDEAHNAGAIGYFCKPVDGYALIDCIRFAERRRP